MTVPEFTLRSEVCDGEATVGITGELDIATAPRLRQLLDTLVDQGARHLILDLADLDFIDSNGLHVLVVSAKRLREHDGELRLRHPKPHTLKVLEMVGLTEVVPVDTDGDSLRDC